MTDIYNFVELLKEKGFNFKGSYFYKCIDKALYIISLDKKYVVFKNIDHYEKIFETENLNDIYCFIMSNF